ncbi:MAG TPA: M1 family metallopeptidase [Vicinamibacterales bacterium]|nr:M1 family metallopeptidase [Vicinamibacterales bacterium]
MIALRGIGAARLRTIARLSVAAAAVSLMPRLSADTYPRQPGIDAWHYTFQLELSDASPEITGEATVDFRVVSGDVRQAVLDLASASGGKGMQVTAVTSAGQPVAYTHRDNRLTLPLPAGVKPDQHVSFTIRYHGAPANGLRLLKNKYGEWCAFSENWPNRAREWLPMIDHPYDKATSEFIVVAPSRYQVVANGLLEESVDLGDGRRRTHWKQSVPIPSWLNAIGVEQFAVHDVGVVKGVELSTWVAHQDDEAGRVYFERPARDALEFFSEHIGPYSYEKLANVAAAGINGGTEHASAIFYGERAVKAEPATNLVTHEVAHQWFGDAVTETDWDDVWLSEGFATYFTLLNTEHYLGRDAFVEGLKASRARVTALERSLPGVSVIHDNLSDMSKVLNQLIYQKGGWTLHMLRGVVGTDRFWEGIREYYRRYRNQSATTDDFRRVMEGVSGQDLGWFFDEWLKRPASPSFAGTWRYDAAAKRIEIELDQTQDGPAFRMPVEFGLAFDAQPVPARRIARVEMVAKHSTFSIPSDQKPISVAFDPDTWLMMNAVQWRE